jgi:hypothetical protein
LKVVDSCFVRTTDCGGGNHSPQDCSQPPRTQSLAEAQPLTILFRNGIMPEKPIGMASGLTRLRRHSIDRANTARTALPPGFHH